MKDRYKILIWAAVYVALFAISCKCGWP